jgi:hypothetical protein
MSASDRITDSTRTSRHVGAHPRDGESVEAKGMPKVK